MATIAETDTPVTGPAGATVVFDIGKTNAKMSLLDGRGATLACERLGNHVVAEGLYPHHDVALLWDWLLATLTRFATLAEIAAIVPVTHGATAALVGDDGLVLPILDYESALPQSVNGQYRAVRPPFAASFSPDLPAGLNLGRQLFWLSQRFPAQFVRARFILGYPQYWAWRLSGVAAGEVTSLGCHTDLWLPANDGYSSLVEAMGWKSQLPPLRPAWAPLGPLLPALARATGVPAACQVLCGIHDSNASLLRYLDAPRTVLSTGTWVIAAALGQSLAGLDESADMLANVNALGQPVACMRFMGGREFAALAGAEAVVCGGADLQCLIDQGTMALPCFAEAGGPFVGRAGRIDGPAPRTAQQAYALATLYVALMSDYCLSALGASGDVVIEGSFTDNPHFGPLLAALRGDQAVALTDDASGTTCGGWLLHHWETRDRSLPRDNRPVEPVALPGLLAYRQRWRQSAGPS